MSERQVLKQMPPGRTASAPYASAPVPSCAPLVGTRLFASHTAIVSSVRPSLRRVSYAPLASMPAEGMWTLSDSHEPCATSPLLAAAMTWMTRPPTLALASMSFNRDVNSPGYSLLTVSRSSPRWDSFFSDPIP